MTVIIGYQADGKAAMAADSLTSGHGHLFVTDRDSKMVRCGPGILGAAGSARNCDIASHVLSVYFGGARTITRTAMQIALIETQLDTSDIELAYIQPRRAIFISGGAVLTVRGPVISAGSGGPIAHAWLDGRGASLENLHDAARYACRTIPAECGGKVQVLVA